MSPREDKKLTDRWGEIIKERAGWKCEICGDSSGELQPHHFRGRASLSTKWYIPNGVCLCFKHHNGQRKSAHFDVVWLKNQLIKQRGKEWFKDLTVQHRKVFKGSYQDVADYLDNKQDNYC